MTKYVSIILLVACLISSLFAYNEGKKAGSSKEKAQCQEKEIDQQKKEIEVGNEIIKSNAEVQQRKTINRAVTPSDNLKWLRKKRCNDCNS